MKPRRFLLPLLLLFGCLGSSARAGSLHGAVRDAVTLAPISAATLTVHVVNPDSIALPTTTDGLGSYSVSDIPAGNQIYAVVVSASGYLYSYARIADLGSYDLQYDVLLAPEPPAPSGDDSTLVQGSVLAISGGQSLPLAGAHIEVQSGQGTVNLSTDAEGRYSSRLPIGSLSFIVSATGYATLEMASVQTDAMGLVVDAVLRPDGVPTQTVSWGRLKGAYR